MCWEFIIITVAIIGARSSVKISLGSRKYALKATARARIRSQIYNSPVSYFHFSPKQAHSLSNAAWISWKMVIERCLMKIIRKSVGHYQDSLLYHVVLILWDDDFYLFSLCESLKCLENIVISRFITLKLSDGRFWQ